MNTYQQLLQADYSTLNQLCNTNPLYSNICTNDNFWRDKLVFQLGPDLLNKKPPNLSWYDYYASQYKIINLIDANHNPIGQIYTTSSSTVGELIAGAIRIMEMDLHGNYVVTVRIGPYVMYSDGIADVWYQRLGNLGVLGYLNKEEELAFQYPHLTDRIGIWDVLDQAQIEIFPLILRTQSKARHSYLKLSSGRLLGSEPIQS